MSFDYIYWSVASRISNNLNFLFFLLYLPFSFQSPFHHKTKRKLIFCKVLSLLEACFDFISGSSLHMKIQIMGGKITENLGFKSPLRKVKNFLYLFSFHFQILHLFLTIFEYLVLQIRYQ